MRGRGWVGKVDSAWASKRIRVGANLAGWGCLAVCWVLTFQAKTKGKSKSILSFPPLAPPSLSPSPPHHHFISIHFPSLLVPWSLHLFLFPSNYHTNIVTAQSIFIAKESKSKLDSRQSPLSSKCHLTALSYLGDLNCPNNCLPGLGCELSSHHPQVLHPISICILIFIFSSSS